jgi:hypothetical protein
MNKLSLEESLKLLAPVGSDTEEEPVPVKTSPKPIRKNKRRVKTPTRSPVRIPTVSPSKKYSPREKIIPIEQKESLYDEDIDTNTKFEKEITNKKVAPHTPTRLNIETPRTPTRQYKDLPEIDENYTIKDKLREYRYSVIKYLVDKDKHTIEYAVCFDPNGQIIFINLDKKITTNVEEHKSVYMRKIDQIPELGSYQNAVTDKITTDISGVVFYNNNGYLFLQKQDNSEYEYNYYILDEEMEKDMVSLTQTFIVLSLKELEKEPIYMLQSSKKNYQIIQQQQLLTNKNTYNNLVNSINELNDNMKKFDQQNITYTDHLVEDWSLLGSFSREYYNKYSKGTLTDKEKEKFDNVSMNMYIRFQNFNEQVFMVNDLHTLIEEVKKISQKLDNKFHILQQKDKKISGKIITTDEASNLI